MPVQIDTIDTEIELTPRPPRADGKASSSSTQPPTASAPQDSGRNVLAVLNAALDEYMRMRG